MHTTDYKDVEFIGAKNRHAALYEWYDGLSDNEVKVSITKIKCRELMSSVPTALQLIVMCNHPFSEETLAIHRAKESRNETAVDRALRALLRVFNQWVSINGMPEEAFLNNGQALVNWQPVEMLPYSFEELSYQEQVYTEMNSHAMDCLELIRIATFTDEDFLKLWEGSNNPFLAAGRLAYGDLEWIQQFPDNFIISESDRDCFLERTSEFAREYLGLCRLGMLSGYESPLTRKISGVILRFQRQYPFNIPDWQLLARQHLDAEIDSSDFPLILHLRIYNEIDSACDLLRSDLLEATDGFEKWIPPLVNSFLPGLRAPESARFFTDVLDNRLEH
ncbi:MAG TPA: hypothetical protein VGZ93_09100 [Candidatus Methylacidiphilales bacterium]|jgi:hypothetical protein|nr:hypothetical protein [Candidatus Methylacidiphilales bacterium]